MMKDGIPGFAWLYFGIAIFQALHSIEEYLTGLYLWMPLVSGRLHEQVAWIPVLDMGEATFATANMVIIAALFALSPFVFLSRPWALRVALVIAVVEIANGIGHLTGAILTGGYFPGCVMGVGLIVCGFAFVRSRRSKKEIL